MSEKIWTISLGVLMTGAGVAHFCITRKYLPIVPVFFPYRSMIVILSGVVELAAGIGLFFPYFSRNAAFIVLLLMVGFLPLHGWDLFRDRPAMSPRWFGVVRFVLQFFLIYWAWRVWRAKQG